MMAKLSSNKDQVAASTLSQVGSVDFAATLRKRIRNREIAQMLVNFCYFGDVLVAERDREVGIDLQEAKAKSKEEDKFLVLG
jgi:hypothetical protein